MFPGSVRHPTQWIIRIRFSRESSVVTGSVVPIASQLMVRFEFYNGAFRGICSWVNLLSLYWLQALDFFLGIDSSSLVMGESVLMLYNTVFYEMTQKPYIYWNGISLIFLFFLSLTLPFIYILFFFRFFYIHQFYIHKEHNLIHI